MTLDQISQLLDKKLKGVATKNDLKEIERRLTKVERAMATKDDLKGFATKDDLKGFATKDDLKGFATKDYIESKFNDLYKFIQEMILGEMGDLFDRKIDNLNNLREEKHRHLDERVENLEVIHPHGMHAN